jgi:LPS export ABC transporter protein LptC
MINRMRQTILKNTRSIAPGILFLLLGTGCRNSMTEINDLTNRTKAGIDQGKDVTILYSRNGSVTARLFGHTFIRAESSKPPYTEMKDGIKVEFFDSMIVKNVLTARYARWYEKENNILIRDSVHLVNDRGEHLYTSEMVWNQNMQLFFTEKPVRIVTPTRTLYGTGMEASQDFANYTIHNLTGNLQLEKSSVPAID